MRISPKEIKLSLNDSCTASYQPSLQRFLVAKGVYGSQRKSRDISLYINITSYFVLPIFDNRTFGRNLLISWRDKFLFNKLKRISHNSV